MDLILATKRLSACVIWPLQKERRSLLALAAAWLVFGDGKTIFLLSLWMRLELTTEEDNPNCSRSRKKAAKKLSTRELLHPTSQLFLFFFSSSRPTRLIKSTFQKVVNYVLCTMCVLCRCLQRQKKLYFVLLPLGRDAFADPNQAGSAACATGKKEGEKFSRVKVFDFN